MNHIFEHDTLSDLQLVIEAPQSHIITAQTGISSETINIFSFISHLCTTHGLSLIHI